MQNEKGTVESIRIGRAENGYVINVSERFPVKKKPETMSGEELKMAVAADGCSMESYEYIAKTPEEVMTKVKDELTESEKNEKGEQ